MNTNGILSDNEIKELSLKSDSPLIKPFKEENIGSSSYILRVGTIHKPKHEEPIIGHDDKKSWIINPGQMIFIVTHEKIDMPKKLIGIVFGSNRITMEGLLIVNPGIITSGHGREITFYAINFSKNAITLTQEEDIARIVFFHTPENSDNPNNIFTDAVKDAEKNAQKNFFSDLDGYFRTLIVPSLKKYIVQLILTVIVGTLFFGAIISTSSVISTIIVDKMQKVPQIQQEISEIKKEMSGIHSNIAYLNKREAEMVLLDNLLSDNEPNSKSDHNEILRGQCISND